MELRIASLEHLNELTQMNLDLRREEKSDTPMSDNQVERRMESFILGNEYKVYMLVNADVVYGYALINFLTKPNYLRQLFIKELYRSNGLGKQFLSKLINELGDESLDVDVMLSNKDAIRFYENYGFQRRYLGLRLTK